MSDTPNNSSDPGQFTIIVRDSRGAGTSEYAFSEGALKVGRDPSNDIVLDSDRVSRTHAIFQIRDGGLLVEDQGSANGVRVNEKKIHGPRDLMDDDVVRIGDFVITTRGNAPRGAVFMRLNGVSPEARGRVFEFIRTPAVIGRGSDADITITHPSISRHHCRVVRRPDGSVVIVDLDSANGLAINNGPVKAAQLLQGDLLRLGQLEFSVELPDLSTLSGFPAIDAGRRPRLSTIISPRVLWIIAVAMLALAAAIAGWKIGDADRDAAPEVRSLQIDEVVE